LKNRSLGLELDKMREQLIQLQMHLIAHTDFPDEVDPPDKQQSLNDLEILIQIISNVAQSAERNRIIREGFQVAILGLPNSGKSSLFNVLLSSERAIVTDIAGTTRDVITETLMLDGVNVTLLDTAGIRETENTVEKIGIERSWLAASQAQAVLYVYDATVGLVEEDTLNLGQLGNLPTLMLANKCDLKSTETSDTILPISAKTGQGIADILSWLEKEIHSQVSQDETSTALSLNQRQRNCVQNILNHLSLVHQTLNSPHLPLDLATVPLSDALYEFDKLSGRDTTEEVLDEVFSQFCVGK
jgi:tRNA modification GTPase